MVRRNRFNTEQVPMVCVVDRCLSDHAALLAAGDGRGAQMQLVTQARDALALARTAQQLEARPIDIWFINVDLPDQSGLQLCANLRKLSPRSSICLVADEYSALTEQAAWRAGATMFRCKPVDPSWLDLWIARTEIPTSLEAVDDLTGQINKAAEFVPFQYS